MTYQNEFPDFGTLDVTLPEGFIDTSWHNDVSPSFTRDNLLIWIDYKEPSDREFPETKRFTLCLLDPEGEYEKTLAHSDNWNIIVSAIDTL